MFSLSNDEMLHSLVKSRFVIFLLIYYGVIQAAHFISLLKAAIIYIKSGVLTFPASPPESGWTSQAEFFLVGMGIFDTFNIVGTFILIYGFFTQRKWFSWFGLINLTAMISSALFFLSGTLPAGAWFYHPFEYISIVILFIPVIILFFLLIKHYFD